MKKLLILAVAVLFSSCELPFFQPETTPPPAADTTPPADVTGLTAVAGNGAVSLSWIPPTDTDLASFLITTPGLSDLNVTAGTNSRLITSLVNGTVYVFTVRAVDASGNQALGKTTTCTPGDSGNITAIIN